MDIRTILLPIRESDTASQLVETGLNTAREWQARIEFLFVYPPAEALVPFGTLGLSASMRKSIVESSSRNSEEQAKRVRELIETACARQGVPIDAEDSTDACASIREEQGIRNELIALHGRLSDLLIVPRPFRTSPPPNSFHAALRESGRPVLMVPRQTIHPMKIDRVAVGWNGSKEAAQAVAAAYPFLRRAAEVHILCSGKRMAQRPNGDDAATYLGRHGIAARVHVFETGKAGVAATLLTCAADLHCELLVVGGYSRPRLREMVMGGVTGHLLEHADRPVLMVH